jgi:hypothetical protein
MAFSARPPQEVSDGEIFLRGAPTASGHRSPAAAVIEGEAMCADCFGRAIRPEEEYLGLMNFLPRLDWRKKIRAQSHRDEQSPMSKDPASQSGNPAPRTATLPAECNSGSFLFFVLSWAFIINYPKRLLYSSLSSL